MTEVEAIEILQEERDYAQQPQYVKCALSLAEEALGKQIPKKMETKKCVCYDGEEQEYEVCTDCGVQVRFAGTMTAKYCWNCGQRVL